VIITEEADTLTISAAYDIIFTLVSEISPEIYRYPSSKCQSAHLWCADWHFFYFPVSACKSRLKYIFILLQASPAERSNPC
ncbi:MAG: hypothetical protein ACI3W5_02035, partial [Faecousia sp.]